MSISIRHNRRAAELKVEGAGGNAEDEKAEREGHMLSLGHGSSVSLVHGG